MTSIYSFKVEMLIHVVGEDEESARAHLDQHGGYVGERDVQLAKTTDISGAPALKLVE